MNVSSVAGRVGRARAGAYSASKFALAGWTESLQLEEREHGVHVGLVLPGFVSTEGFPQEQLTRRRTTRWIVSTPEKVADAIVDAGPGGKAERYVPRVYGVVPALRHGLPGVWRRVGSGAGGCGAHRRHRWRGPLRCGVWLRDEDKTQALDGRDRRCVGARPAGGRVGQLRLPGLERLLSAGGHPACTGSIQQRPARRHSQRPRLRQRRAGRPDAPGVTPHTNIFDERFDLFGFASANTRTTARYTSGPHAGSGQVSGFNAAGAWKITRGRPSVKVAILDTGINWDNAGLRDKVALNRGELPKPENF